MLDSAVTTPGRNRPNCVSTEPDPSHAMGRNRPALLKHKLFGIYVACTTAGVRCGLRLACGSQHANPRSGSRTRAGRRPPYPRARPGRGRNREPRRRPRPPPTARARLVVVELLRFRCRESCPRAADTGG
ncbi:hypothetical protein BDA96_10G258800 [Sorghum bicolor]|jgi:hypothetical protein|uniref:Uncharacterized protein n=1 Tax=Sorghum bicolor TaxID=4558 RepID=A0A921Q4I7_SORBI|nr:hypothetical protein BDA96_10G258800 [Sorghum bicolor]